MRTFYSPVRHNNSIFPKKMTVNAFFRQSISSSEHTRLPGASRKPGYSGEEMCFFLIHMEKKGFVFMIIRGASFPIYFHFVKNQ